ncbi:MAG TPA: hypothetical protein VKG82_01245 [Solirubrobacteraceae bacterium]|nr:hypothetical protein [Solirubrobacteraceae bacterium]
MSVSLASSSPAETSITVSAGPSTEGGVVSDPIDPKYLLDVPFGKTSFWLQPWRAYLDTRPGSQLLHAVGVNFDVSSSDAEAAAQLLQESGFVLARVEIDWSDLDYSNPQTLRSNNEASIRAHLTALHNHGLRPLIVLNSNSTAPAPLELVKLETTETAPKGANTVKLTAASAARVVPGKTGFNELTWTGSPDVLITSVEPGGVAKLSRPLPEPLSAGPHGGTTLLYAPFQAPTLRNGRSNPAFQATLAGWLSYVGTVCREAQAILGPGGFDLEIWNELTFGSQFLNGENYGPPAGNGSERAEHKAQVTKAVIRTLLGATVAYVRNPANGISPGVAITDGFASQTPFPSGAYAPLGLNALSKHPYVVGLDYPGAYRPSFIRPVNALGTQDLAPKSPPPFVPLFIPSFETLLPEFTLMGESTETLIRDIAPITTEIYGLPHGREVGPSGGPPLQKWITEYNLGVPHGSPELTPADEAHFHAKALLRSLVAMVSKGISREYFFAAAPGPFGLIGNEFFAALEAHPGTYPGQALGGEVMNAFRNLLAAFGGPGPSGSPRPLTLSSITQEGNHAQFSGDGTAAHPNLYDREVLAVFPYQTSPTEFVIPVYVMTSYLLTDYQPGAPTSDVHRFDLPDESFRITLGSLPEGASPTVSAYDPLLGAQTPARLVSRVGGTAVFEVAATDYPRLLRLSYSGAA